MNTNALKIFAQQTRKKLRELVQTKLKLVLTTDSAELRGREKDIETLKTKIALSGEDAVVEEVAYTWFNRVMAFRFMDANGYTNPRIVTPAEGQQRPEILQDALSGSVLEELFISVDEVNDLLSGRTGVADPQAALYRRLLVAECNRWGEVMPFLFERIADYTELLLPDDLLSERSFVTDIRQGMSDDDCQDVEIIGWLYQFYVSEENERLIQSKKKYKREELAPASQLFTPEWIVRYMVDNTLGQYWSEMYPDSNLADTLEFYITPDDVSVLPKRKIKPIEEIKFYDPCVGSAHILSYAFDVFYKMYEELGYSHSEIPKLIIENNLWGTDIDPRAAQLSSFVLSMKGRKCYNRLFRKGVMPNITYYRDFEEDEKFGQAASLGSLITVTEDDVAERNVSSQEIDLFNQRYESEHLNKLYQILGQRYDLVVTNPPYISSSRMDDTTKSYVEANYPETKSDLFATFVFRCLELCNPDGLTGYMTPFVWMFISSYEQMRKRLIEDHFINNLVQLEYSGFDGATVPICTFTIRNKPLNAKGCYIRLNDFKGSQNQAPKTLEAIQNRNCGWFFTANQNEFEKIPGSPIGYWVSNSAILNFKKGVVLDKLCTMRQGMASGDNNRFIRDWFEVEIRKCNFNATNKNNAFQSGCKWFPIDKGGGFRKWYGLNENLINFNFDSYTILKKMGNKCPSEDLYFYNGLTWGKISSSKFSVRYSDTGAIFSDAGMKIVFKDSYPDSNLLAFMNSKISLLYLKVFSETFNFEKGNLAKLPIVNINKDIIGGLSEKCIIISRQDWDAHEISWNFKISPLIEPVLSDTRIVERCNFSLMNSSLKNRYGNYVNIWRERFFQLHANEEELNRQFIEIYGLQDELTPDVPLEEITILQQGEIKFVDGDIEFQADVVMKQFISYLVGCFMGRYSVDKPGLIIADTNVDLHSLGLKVQGLEGTPQDSTLEIDDDGIIPILDDEYFNDDMTVRIQGAIEKLFGRESYAENIRFMEEALGKELRKYMDKDFYKEHVQRYKKRPIYWMFSSAKGTFKALVYMHRLQSDSLSKMHADYVLPFISMLEQKRAHLDELQVREDISSAEMNRARKEIEQLRSKLMEVRDFEQRLVAMASRRITIDLDDGVRINYPKFGDLLVKIPGLEKE
ncbi:BREX-1 system adenine-specific DNA-methyltransferase PglX [Macellibacteroides fermentans]|uniref:site-specific DNA-methyltransferase (adenine-specific) n=1 Tax=Macellibacteroides fermentans TaxID=879969 RepID=A0A8E2D699_9PORP|nr:BREX-1 system adenine-specific DNA-methyltransferase PglX [Macellibacteroides fermentans]NYI50660.1 hypothetical protein [Macellibacteroides fermentans]